MRSTAVRKHPLRAVAAALGTAVLASACAPPTVVHTTTTEQTTQTQGAPAQTTVTVTKTQQSP